MAINLKPVDVAVVGLGAAGGVAVLPLTRAGLKVTALEAGSWMRPDPVQTRRNSQQRSKAGHHRNQGLGRNSNLPHRSQPAHAPQRRSSDDERGGPNAIPKGSTLEDWPLSYDDLEFYYDAIEYEIGVSGKAGNILGKIDPRGNVFEGQRRREYPMPPLRDTDFTDMMQAGARKLGWNPHRSPAAINSQPYGGRSACVYHGFCDTGGCHVGAKNSTSVTTIPAAQKTKNLTIVERAHVTRVLTDNNGKVTGVQYLRAGREYIQPAKVVLLASYTYENVRLLLLSRSKAYPNGLSNNHGQVGKHYIGHWAGREVTALFPVDLNIWSGAFAQGVVVNNWADDNFDHSGLGFIGGASLTVNHEVHPIAAAAMPTFGRAPAWGAKWKAFVRENAGRWIGAYAQCNTFPYQNTYLDLDPEVKDRVGDPVCRITSGPRENEPRASAYAGAKAAEWFRAAGAVELVTAPNTEGPVLSTHAVGGTRMGGNPETNVVDKWCFSHEAPNLGILGGSVACTHGARNPTLTIQALCWRTAEHLVKNWKSIAG